jgi:hypothetical protein
VSGVGRKATRGGQCRAVREDGPGGRGGMVMADTPAACVSGGERGEGEKAEESLRGKGGGRAEETRRGAVGHNRKNGAANANAARGWGFLVDLWCIYRAVRRDGNGTVGMVRGEGKGIYTGPSAQELREGSGSTPLPLREVPRLEERG